jgi:hypothetical protein
VPESMEDRCRAEIMSVDWRGSMARSPTRGRASVGHVALAKVVAFDVVGLTKPNRDVHMCGCRWCHRSPICQRDLRQSPPDNL